MIRLFTDDKQKPDDLKDLPLVTFNEIFNSLKIKNLRLEPDVQRAALCIWIRSNRPRGEFFFREVTQAAQAFFQELDRTFPPASLELTKQTIRNSSGEVQILLYFLPKNFLQHTFIVPWVMEYGRARPIISTIDTPELRRLAAQFLLYHAKKASQREKAIPYKNIPRHAFTSRHDRRFSNIHGVWEIPEDKKARAIRIRRQEPVYSRRTKENLQCSCFQRFKPGRCMARRSRIDVSRCRNCAETIRVTVNNGGLSFFHVCGWHSYDRDRHHNTFIPAIPEPMFRTDAKTLSFDRIKAGVPDDFSRWKNVMLVPDDLWAYSVDTLRCIAPYGLLSRHDLNFQVDQKARKVAHDRWRLMFALRRLEILLRAPGGESPEHQTKRYQRQAYIWKWLARNHQHPDGILMDGNDWLPDDNQEKPIWDPTFREPMDQDAYRERVLTRYFHENRPAFDERPPPQGCDVAASDAATGWDALSSFKNGLDIKKSTLPGAGLGLFATRAFETGDLITEYSGVLLTPQEFREVRKTRKNAFLISIGQGKYGLSFAQKRHELVAGVPVAAMANDARSTARQNAALCELDRDVPRDHPHRTGPEKLLEKLRGVGIYLRATRPIKEGEEILTAYNPRSWAGLH